ncbi:hypothetical protein FPZ49_12080 [Paenibacillus cremeus]|uniref:Uncharacterized protein n=2 Tax=Paenibacillus cremeus TaxID=2163881 RepID=A0A559KCC9_9BACL|nr:hypothetical protein FPZ49_12080 [Paenibacillus cremeus]
MNYAVVTVLAIGAILWILGALKQRRRRGPFAPSKKKLSMQKQSCSYCRRKVNPKELSFYSAPAHGKVIGVCKACKPQAERQSLLRL